MHGNVDCNFNACPPGIICPAIPMISNAQVSQKSLSVFDDFATVVCDQGYRTLEGGTALLLQCMEDSDWNYTMSTLSCEGEDYYW